MIAEDFLKTMPLTASDLIRIKEAVEAFNPEEQKMYRDRWDSDANEVILIIDSHLPDSWTYVAKVIIDFDKNNDESIALDTEFTFLPLKNRTLKLTKYGHYKGDRRIGDHYTFSTINGKVVSKFNYSNWERMMS